MRTSLDRSVSCLCPREGWSAATQQADTDRSQRWGLTIRPTSLRSALWSETGRHDADARGQQRTHALQQEIPEPPTSLRRSRVLFRRPKPQLVYGLASLFLYETSGGEQSRVHEGNEGQR